MEEIESEYLNEDSHPQYFYPGSYVTEMNDYDKDERSKIYTFKNPEKYTLTGTKASYLSRFLTFKVSKCDRSVQNANCASEEEIKEYLSNHRLGMITAFNYIDFN